MKKILGLGIAALLIMAMVGGGTWAYFSDTETSANNLLTAGTLDLGLANSSLGETGGSVNATWTSPAGWKPGDNVTATLYLKNSGTIAMSSVNVTFAQLYTSGNLATIHGNFPGGATDNLTQMISASVATWNGTGSVIATSFQSDNLTQLSGNGTMNLGSLAPGIEAAFRIVWLFNTAATNGCQGGTENVTLTLTGNQ